MSDDDEIDRLIDTDPIALGNRCRQAERDLALALADVVALTIKVGEGRDLAFRAAFSPEEGASVRWGLQYPEDQSVSSLAPSDAERMLGSDLAPFVRRQVVGPWKVVSSGPWTQILAAGEGE